MSLFKFNHKAEEFSDALGIEQSIIDRFKGGAHKIIVKMMDDRNLPDSKSEVLEIVEEELHPITPLEYFLIGMEFGEYCKSRDISIEMANKERLSSAKQQLMDLLKGLRGDDK